MEKDSLRKWLEGAMDDKEKEAFESTDDFKKLQRILEGSQKFMAPEYDVEAELEKVKSRKNSFNQPKIIKKYDRKVLFKLAASIIIFVSIYWFFLRTGDVKVDTLAGQKTETILPDSSEVIINSFSSISYSERKWKRKRLVQLKGEAFFKVRKGSSFEVKTKNGIISVLGTQFNVKQRGELLEVSCFEGKVKVVAKDFETQLGPSQVIRLYNGKAFNLNEKSSVLPDWIENKSHFESMPYYEVVNELERQYDVEIELKDIDSLLLFTGGFTHDDLNLALKSISIPLNATFYNADERHIIIVGEN